MSSLSPEPPPATPPGKSDSWYAVFKNVAGLDQPHSLAGTLWAIARQPLAEPVRLALDDSYKSHGKFFTAFYAGTATLLFVTLPNWASRSLGDAPAANAVSTAESVSVQFALLVVTLPLAYYIFQQLSSERRTPMAFLKLSMLGAGAGALVYAATFAVLAFGWAVVTLDAPDETPAQLQAILQRILMAASFASLAYGTLVHARFWAVTWWQSLAVFAGLAIPTFYLARVLYALLAHAPKL